MNASSAPQRAGMTTAMIAAMIATMIAAMITGWGVFTCAALIWLIQRETWYPARNNYGRMGPIGRANHYFCITGATP